MLHLLPWILTGLTSYLLMGMIVTHYTSLGKKYFVATPIRLIFFWAFPVIGIVLYVITMIFSILVVDIALFGDKNINRGLEKLLDELS